MHEYAYILKATFLAVYSGKTSFFASKFYVKFYAGKLLHYLIHLFKILCMSSINTVNCI